MKDWRQNAYLLLGSLTGTESTGTGSSHTPRRRCRTVPTDHAEDDSEEPTPGPSQTKENKKGESKQGNCYYFSMP